MFSLSRRSLINSKVLQFYKIKELEELKNVTTFFHANGAYNPIKIVEYLWPNLKSNEIFQDLDSYKYEDYLRCCNKLQPIFHYTPRAFRDLNKNALYCLKIDWMGNNVDSYLNMRDNYNNNATKFFEHTLLLTSLLANAISNVYLSCTKAKRAPHLLKDLINSSEIVDIFGIEMVILLKILMGSPNSINIRNIVWHGFPKPLEIPGYYADVLLVTIHTLGCIIEDNNIQVKSRDQITTFYKNMNVFELKFQLTSINFASIAETLERINNDFHIYWQQLLKYYEAQRYKEFIILALPQIELLLRLHYGTANNCDISAKLDEYYITIDTIFTSHISNGDKQLESSNKLLDFENSNLEGCFHLLYDLFLSPNGCRLRDKVSHGEVHLEALNNSQLCSLVLHVFLVLLFPHEIKILQNYESKLHLNCTAKGNLIKASEKIKAFYVTKLQNKQDLIQYFLKFDGKILIFKRPKKEAELMFLINNIAENVYRIILNYEDSIETRCALLAQRELHSKRRKTLEKIQIALPDIFRILSLIIGSSTKIFKELQNNSSTLIEDNIVYDKTLRYLKRCLSITQNFLKYSHCESNEWIKCLELCRKFYAVFNNLYVYDNYGEQ